MTQISERPPRPGKTGAPGGRRKAFEQQLQEKPVRSRGRRWLRRVVITLVILMLLVGAAGWFFTQRYAGNVSQISGVFSGLDANRRPQPSTSGSGGDPVTFLLVGSDSRTAVEAGALPTGRSDAIMVARISGDRSNAQLISIPRDSWVPIPGHGTSKINASYAWGGPALLINTVEQLTQVRIDHFVAIDFAGIAKVTDALGGVDVEVARTTTSGPFTFTAGVNHITGDEARWYLGQRHGLAGGDFDRVKRQQAYLQAVFEQLVNSDTFTDPGKLDDSLRALTGAVGVDDTLSSGDLLSLTYSLRDLTPGRVESFTAPVAGTGREGAASVVYLDNTAASRMWTYLREGALADHAAEFAEDATPDVPS
jgi:LCP family protein required for cell wall assembly